MTRRLVLLVLLVLLSVLHLVPPLGAGAAPRFEDFPAEVPLFSPRKVDLDSHPRARRHRTVLRAAAAAGPNFAGKHALVSWGCGTGCVEWALIDLESGRVFFITDLTPLAWVTYDEEADEPGYFDFRPDSTLLVLRGAATSRRLSCGGFVGQATASSSSREKRRGRCRPDESAPARGRATRGPGARRPSTAAKNLFPYRRRACT